MSSTFTDDQCIDAATAAASAVAGKLVAKHEKKQFIGQWGALKTSIDVAEKELPN